MIWQSQGDVACCYLGYIRARERTSRTLGGLCTRIESMDNPVWFRVGVYQVTLYVII
jgi:hypothetical protein